MEDDREQQKNLGKHVPKRAVRKKILVITFDENDRRVCIHPRKVNEKSDIYSFGVVLLELVTGKHSIIPNFEESKDLVKWVRTRIEKSDDGLQDVLDSRVIVDCFQEEMAAVLDIHKEINIYSSSTLPCEPSK